MADNETIADIIAEMRVLSNPTSDGIIAINGRRIADRLEAAHRRERGDAAKLREAVGYILKYADSVACRDHDEHTRHYIDQIRKWAQSALSAPPRNCDVGSAQEQIERWQAFCNRYDDDCTGCPCEAADTWNYTTCFAKWTQLPYEGGEK